MGVGRVGRRARGSDVAGSGGGKAWGEDWLGGTMEGASGPPGAGPPAQLSHTSGRSLPYPG